MKIIFNLLVFFSLTLFMSFNLQARNFYQTDFSLKVSYTNLWTGSTHLYNGKIYINFSDDAQFCVLKIGVEEIPCQISGFEGTFEPKIDLVKEIVIMAFLTKLQEAREVKDTQRISVQRLILLYPNPVTRMDTDHSYDYQLHDDQPEAIHIHVSNLSYSRLL